MPASPLTALRRYAQAKPESFPASILFSHTDTSLILFDAFPKSIFHFLILPRVIEPLGTSDLDNLHALLNRDKNLAHGVLLGLRDDAHALQAQIEEEMVERFGFKWDVWVGFHGAPSMPHLHLHVLSADLCSDRMKNKKHYNSFHPEHGFFLHMDDVLSWFDAEPSVYRAKSRLKPSVYERILLQDLTCFHCGSSVKNMPTLKAHLQEEWNKLELLHKNSKPQKNHKESDRNAMPDEADTEKVPASKAKVE